MRLIVCDEALYRVSRLSERFVCDTGTELHWICSLAELRVLFYLLCTAVGFFISEIYNSFFQGWNAECLWIKIRVASFCCTRERKLKTSIFLFLYRVAINLRVWEYFVETFETIFFLFFLGHCRYWACDKSRLAVVNIFCFYTGWP
jgi:hypothetical protein